MLPENLSGIFLVDRVIKLAIWGGVVVGIFSFGILFYILWRYSSARNPEPQDKIPEFIKRVTYLDFIMLVFDILLLIISTQAWAHVFLRGKNKVFEEAKKKNKDVVEIQVIGRQFFWQVNYPGEDGKFGTADDFTLGNYIVVPEDTYVSIDLSSGDTLHAFFAPHFRIKYDAIPGRKTWVWFKTTKAGEYEFTCAELCGALHYRMRGIIKVLPKREYEDFLKRAGGGMM